jgi:hypothetical protein
MPSDSEKSQPFQGDEAVAKKMRPNSAKIAPYPIQNANAQPSKTLNPIFECACPACETPSALEQSSSPPRTCLDIKKDVKKKKQSRRPRQTHPTPPQTPRIRLANWISFCIIVTLLA